MRSPMLLLSALVTAVATVSASPAPQAADATPDTTSPDFSTYAQCRTVTFQVRASASNVVFADPPSPTDETAIVDFIAAAFHEGGAPTSGTQTVSGTYTIAGQYCVPARVRARNVLQLIVHGISYNKTMWTGLGYGNQYNWPLFAAFQGYPSLTIDRLGHGSSEPTIDPTNINQVPLQVAIYHNLIQQIKAGGRGSPLPAFSSIAWVGHSFGSMIGAAAAEAYPDDSDAIVLTGFSTALNLAAIPETPTNFESAALLYPSRYQGTPLGYVALATEALRQAFFYAGNFDPAIPVGDFKFADDFSVGEIGTFVAAFPFPVSAYRGPVFVTSGALDAIFCTVANTTCDSILNATRADFPNARAYGYYSPPETGHCLTLHRSAPQTFAVVHAWLNNHL